VWRLVASWRGGVRDGSPLGHCRGPRLVGKRGRDGNHHRGISAHWRRHRDQVATRALKLANDGSADGDIQRIDAVKTSYKNLIQIRPAINQFEASAFSANQRFNVTRWDSLRPFRIGIIRGLKFAERNAKGMSPVLVGDYKALLTMLDRGRLDIGILPRVNGMYQVVKWGTLTVRELKPALQNLKLYHYVNTKHAGLARRLAEVIQAMHTSGELVAMRKAATADLLSGASRAHSDK
jgi:polar amino acid transport system substrate-binding protein